MVAVGGAGRTERSADLYDKDTTEDTTEVDACGERLCCPRARHVMQRALLEGTQTHAVGKAVKGAGWRGKGPRVEAVDTKGLEKNTLWTDLKDRNGILM